MTRAGLLGGGLALTAALALLGAMTGCSEGSDSGDGTGATGGGSGDGSGGGGATDETGGGAGSTSDTGGSGGGAGSPPLGTDGWTFDTDDEGWNVGWAQGGSFDDLDSDTFADYILVSWSETEGNPDPGALQVVVPFDDVSQKAHIRLNLDPGVDFTGRVMTARVRLESGCNENIAEVPCGAKAFVKTTQDYIWIDGGWTNLENHDWITITVDPANPVYSDAGYDIADVREVGIELGTGDNSSVSYEEAVFYIDSVTY